MSRVVTNQALSIGAPAQSRLGGRSLPCGWIALEVGPGFAVADGLPVSQQLSQVHVKGGGPIGVIRVERHHP